MILLEMSDYMNLSSRVTKYLILILCVLIFSTGCKDKDKTRFKGNALLVTHSPNPSNIHKSKQNPNPVSPYIWYYKTVVKNNSDRDLKVIWFESYLESNNHWLGSNILNRTLRNDVFLEWYGNGEWISPGKSRICDPNWHSGSDTKGNRVKWAYIAIDKFGNDYYSEAIVESLPIE